MAYDYTTGFMAKLAASDPDKVAALMAKQGIRPPPLGAGPMPGDRLGQLLAPQGPLTGLASAVAPTGPAADVVTPATPAAPRPGPIGPSDALMQLMLGARRGALPPGLAALLGGR